MGHIIAPRLAGAARALLAQHRDAGEHVILTTATNRFLAEPIAALPGIASADLIATELETEHGRFTGSNAGVLNMREDKVTRLRAWLTDAGIGESALDDAVFYSDSSNDVALLRAVGRPVAVDPDPGLRAEAERCGAGRC